MHKLETYGVFQIPYSCTEYLGSHCVVCENAMSCESTQIGPKSELEWWTLLKKTKKEEEEEEEEVVKTETF